MNFLEKTIPLGEKIIKIINSNLYLFKDYSKYIFLTGFFLIIAGSLDLPFLKKYSFFEVNQNIIIYSKDYITALTVFFGFLFFYLNKKKIKEKSEETERKLFLIEKEREENFCWKFPYLNRVPFLKKIGKRIYKKKWQAIGVFFVFILFWAMRLYYNDFVNGSDNHNVVAIKNLYENGISFYKYHPITDFFMIWMVRLFGFNFFSIKIPFLIYSFITLIFIYLCGKLINKNLGLLSAFLFSISPWAIIQSRITRDYSFDLMIGSVALFFCLLIYKKIRENKNFKRKIKYTAIFLFIPFFIFLIHRYNRFQTLTNIVYPAITLIFIIHSFVFLKIKKNIIYAKATFLFNTITIIIAGSYFMNERSFDFGFRKPDFIFLDMFFDPVVRSPWQWFHNSDAGIYLFLSLFFLGIFSFNFDKKSQKILLILLSCFSFGLFLFIFKYESHINYIPVRYVYFLFTPYVIIFSNAILNLLKVSENKILKTAIIISLFLLINQSVLLYSIKPILAYEKKQISEVAIDNIRVGRFEVKETAEFLKKTEIDKNITMVFSGFHEEFILYLNKPMDKNRFLARGPNQNWLYDISENTYVQSNSYKHFELKKAVKENKKGLFISHERYTLDDFNRKIYLREGDFYAFETSFNFIKRINNINIYYWDKNEKYFPY